MSEEKIKRKDGMAIFVDRSQLKRHINEVCKERRKSGDKACDKCPFKPYVEAYLDK